MESRPDTQEVGGASVKGESGEDGDVGTRDEGMKKKAGLDPSTFTLVEAAQYGNLDR